MKQFRKPEVGWKKLNELAREYHNITQKLLPNGGKIYYESGKDPDTKEIVRFEIDSRSERQKELAAEIIEGAYPYIRKVVGKLMYGEGQDAKGKNGKTTRFYLYSLQDFSTVDDLVGSAAIGIMKSLHNYNPNISISTFIHSNTVWKLSREANPSLISLPDHIKKQVTKAIKNGNGSTLKHYIQNELNVTDATLGTISLAITGNYTSIDKLVGSQSFMNPRYGVPRRKSFAEAFLADESFSGNTQQQVEESLMADAVKEQLKTLTEREEKVIKLRYGIGEEKRVSQKESVWYRTLEEIAPIFNVSRDRIMQIQAKAERKLRHPTRAKPLKIHLRALS